MQEIAGRDTPMRPQDLVLVRLSIHLSPQHVRAYDMVVMGLDNIPDELPRIAEEWAAQIRKELER